MSTDDSPEREFDVYDGEGLPVAHGESTSILSESETISNRSNPKPGRKPRREVWWLDLGTATNHSLTSIGRCFEDRLNWSLLSSSNSLLRHIRLPKDNNLRRNLHQCPGYLREEITLTCDLSKSVIVSHAFPGPSERCSICHQLVQYTYSASSARAGLLQPSLPSWETNVEPISTTTPGPFPNKFRNLEENWQMTAELLADIERADKQQAQYQSAQSHPYPSARGESPSKLNSVYPQGVPKDTKSESLLASYLFYRLTSSFFSLLLFSLREG